MAGPGHVFKYTENGNGGGMKGWEVLRCWGLPGHIRTCYVEQLANLEIYFKFNEEPNQELKDLIYTVLDKTRLISHPLMLYVSSSTNDQEVIPEDSEEWSTEFKGFKLLGRV